MKTREQLKSQGVLLRGPIIPDWFKGKCDGCSAPKPARKWATVSQLTAACYIHDFRYTTIPILFHHKTEQYKDARRYADVEFYENCKATVSNDGESPVRGLLLTRVVYSSVRMFGRWALDEPTVTGSRMPINKEQLSQFVGAMHECWPSTRLGNLFIDRLESRIQRMLAWT